MTSIVIIRIMEMRNEQEHREFCSKQALANKYSPTMGEYMLAKSSAYIAENPPQQGRFKGFIATVLTRTFNL